MFVYPLSFNEYLDAVGERGLLSLKAKATTTMRLPEPVHQKLIQHVKRFLVLEVCPR